VDFWDGLSLKQISESDAVICCVDNFEARIQLNQLCLMASTDFYNTGIDSRHSSVEVFPFATDPDCACFECCLPSSAYLSIQKRYSCGLLRKVAFEEKKIPTTAITSSLAGSLVVSMLLNRINQHPQAIQGAVRHFQDSITLEATLSKYGRNGNCPTCGSVRAFDGIVSARRSSQSAQDVPLAHGATGEIILSESVLMRGVCQSCGRQQEYFESARKLTDAVTFCSICGKYSVQTEFVQRMSIHEFEEVFAGKTVPCKFITCRVADQEIVIEMED
jgi:hypothetical protein